MPPTVGRRQPAVLRPPQGLARRSLQLDVSGKDQLLHYATNSYRAFADVASVEEFRDRRLVEVGICLPRLKMVELAQCPVVDLPKRYGSWYTSAWQVSRP